MKQANVAGAWERWRDRFLEERLRGVVCLPIALSQLCLSLILCIIRNSGARRSWAITSESALPNIPFVGSSDLRMFSCRQQCNI